MLLRWKCGVVLLVLGLLSGCTNLAAVRQYAETADASLAKVPDVVSDFSGSCQRRAGFQPPERQPDCSKVKAETAPLLEVVTLLQKYNQSLGKLAADEAITFTADLDKLEQQVTGLNRFDKDRVAATVSMADYLSKLATERYRRQRVQQAIKANNQPIQTVIAGVADIIESDYRSLLENEQLAINKHYRGMETRYADTEPLALSLALRERQADQQAVAKKLEGITPLVTLIRKVASEHDKLNGRAGQLGSEEVFKLVKAYVDEAKPVLKQIKDAYQ
ncbi:MAG: hypothetical protein OIF55_07025 [Amphritea sp.]|nr:hypothetical protein [Amphritea sp.]